MVKPLIIAITGASGALYAQRLIRFLTQKKYPLHLIFSDNGRIVWQNELGEAVPQGVKEQEKLFRERYQAENLFCHGIRDLSAPVSSGSFLTAGMVVIPCTMGTLSGIANGSSDNLIERAADVVLKEGRKLVIVPRETPLNAIHLANMLKLSQAGAKMIPAMPAFYQQPRTLEDLADFIAGKVLDGLEIEHDLFRRWQ